MLRNGRQGRRGGTMAEATGWLGMERARREGRAGYRGTGCLTSCGGVMTKMAVRADGVMVPCSQVPHVELGRINRDSLKGVWQDHPELKRLRERRLVPLSDFEFCRGCDYIPYCRGSCPAIAYTLLGKEDHPSPDAFLRKFLQEGGRFPRESLESGSSRSGCAVKGEDG